MTANPECLKEVVLINQSEPNKDVSVGGFFDALTSDYTETIERCFPRYREMLWALLDYLPEGHACHNILELGCGTGNLSVLLAEAFPNARICVVDVSEESLDACRSRMPDADRVICEAQDIRQLDFENESFDLVASSIAVHHLTAAEKVPLFRDVAGWLKPGGIFTFVDQFRGETEDLYQRHIHNWKKLSLSAGSSEEEFRMWMTHQKEHDHHDTLRQQLSWLEAAGFGVVDCTWRYLLWSVVQARKV